VHFASCIVAKQVVCAGDLKPLRKTTGANDRGTDGLYFTLPELKLLVPHVEAMQQEAMLLGQDEDGRAVFTISLDIATSRLANESLKFVDLRVLAMAGLSSKDASVLGHARSLLLWAEAHKFCGFCGSSTSSMEGGAMRKCNDDKQASCNSSHYPRTDAVVISLVTRAVKDSNAQEALLCRMNGLPPGLYTCVSGFLEPGETIEEAAAREVYEEVGVKVSHVQYVKSQPWPLPRGAVAGQLMLGCIARADEDTSTDISVDLDEIDDAKWFTAEQVRDGLARSIGKDIAGSEEAHPLLLPPPLAIAHELAKEWVATHE
jgi:NAD+ diphosphatase